MAKSFETKVVNRFKQIYYAIPCGMDQQIDYDTMEKGDKAILKKLIYLGSLSLCKDDNKIDAHTIERICAHYDLHYYKDIDSDKHPNTYIRYIAGIKVLVNLDEDEYFDQIEMATHDFRVKNAYQTTLDKIIKDFQALIKSEALIEDCCEFANNHFSTENIKFEARHEKMRAEGFEACRHIIFDIAHQAHENTSCNTKIRFIGSLLRPRGITVFDQVRNKEHYGIGIANQEENQKGLYISIKGINQYLVLFDLDENNKINLITLIRGSMVDLYNIVDVNVDTDFWG